MTTPTTVLTFPLAVGELGAGLSRFPPPGAQAIGQAPPPQLREGRNHF